MQNKLQELTDKLYNEGLSKGRQEGEAIVNDAKVKAEEILAAARKEAEDIVARARKEADELKAKVDGDLKMAARESIAATRQDIEKLIVARMSEKETRSALTSASFVKEIITSVAKNFSPDAPADLEIVLPESLRKELEPFIMKELTGIIGSGVTAGFSRKITGGFTIGPKDGGYFISFTDETFIELISGYLRPATRKILFG